MGKSKEKLEVMKPIKEEDMVPELLEEPEEVENELVNESIEE